MDENKKCVECLLNSKIVKTEEGEICRKRASFDDLLPSDTDHNKE